MCINSDFPMSWFPYNTIYRLKGVTQPKSTISSQAACKNWDYKKFLYSKKGAAIGFQNLTVSKFRKTQRDRISELEEPSSFLQDLKELPATTDKANLRLSNRGWGCDQKIQPKSLRKDDIRCGIHTCSFPHITEPGSEIHFSFLKQTVWASEIKLPLGFLLKKWTGSLVRGDRDTWKKE